MSPNSFIGNVLIQKICIKKYFHLKFLFFETPQGGCGYKVFCPFMTSDTIPLCVNDLRNGSFWLVMLFFDSNI